MATTEDTQIRLQRLYQQFLGIYLALGDISLAAGFIDITKQDREPRFANALGLCMNEFSQSIEQLEKFCKEQDIDVQEAFKNVVH